MRSWLILEEATSTQDVVAELSQSDSNLPSIIFAHHQLVGRGRFGRNWESEKGDSLTMSVVFSPHSKPWLIGMAVALSCARVLGGGVQWPNDVVINGKKVGGVLTELIPSKSGEKLPVVGIGININQTRFNIELSEKATSVFIETGVKNNALDVAQTIVEEIDKFVVPNDWCDLSENWSCYDKTPGKRYRLHTDVVVLAVGVNEEGALLCEDGTVVLAADALFGSQ